MEIKSVMKESSDLNRRIGVRVRGLRVGQALSLDTLARRSGVSRSMISQIERGASSPTAAVLEKLAAGLQVVLATLFDEPGADGRVSDEPIVRRVQQPVWQDPESGYVRRNVSPTGVAQPMRIVEVRFPPGGRVAFEPSVRDDVVYQQVWMLAGTIEITVGATCHRLRIGDCLAMQLDGPTMFHNPARAVARYAVVTAGATKSRR